MSYAFATDHLAMVFDEVRNRGYERALRQILTPDSVVLDLGAGVGIHGLVAARLGARKVYLVEPQPVIATAARIAAANGLSSRVHCVAEAIESAHIPEPVDVIVSVFTGHFLLTEDLLPSLFFARDRFLAPGGRLIPDCARMELVPVSAAELFSARVEKWSQPSQGLDLSAARLDAANWVYFDTDGQGGITWLAAPETLMTLDLSLATSAECRGRVEFCIEERGTCHGLLGWFSIRLGDDWLSTSPRAPKTHWTQAFLPVDPPVPVTKGQRCTVEVVRAEGGDWTWTFESNDVLRRHSTFFVTAPLPSALKKVVGDYRPTLSPEGSALRDALSLMSEGHTLTEIERRLLDEHPAFFRSARKAESFVRRLSRRYS